MRLLGNILWLFLAGFWLAVGYLVAGVVAFVLIVTIPSVTRVGGLRATRLAAGRRDADVRPGRPAVGPPSPLAAK